MKNVVFDHRKYMTEQVIEALTCPINRHCTRKEYGCDDWFLWNNPKLLLEHFLRNGGAEEFAKRRSEFVRIIETPDEPDYEI